MIMNVLPPPQAQLADTDCHAVGNAVYLIERLCERRHHHL